MVDSEFVLLMLEQGLSKELAFSKSFPELCEGKTEEEITALATKRLNRKDNLTYYNAKAAEYDRQNKEKYQWNLDVSNSKIGKMIDFLEDKVYNEGSEKMAILSTLKDLYKEKDLINGIQEHKISVEINPMRPVGENKLKTYDENGNIVDGDFKEVKEERNEGV